MLDQRPTLLWGVAIPAVIAAGMVWSARVGQTLARDQMRLLRDALEEALMRSEDDLSEKRTNDRV